MHYRIKLLYDLDFVNSMRMLVLSTAAECTEHNHYTSQV